MAKKSIEERLTALEEEVAKIKAMLKSKEADNVPWFEQIYGQFAGDPVYLEAMKLGRKYRESLRPKPRKRKKEVHGGP